MGNKKTCTFIPQQWRKKTSNKRKNSPDKTKNMKIKKTKSGLHSPEDEECLARSVFDPRAPADRFSNFKNEDWEKIAVASSGTSALLCFIKTDYVDHKMQVAKSA